ncbi:MAG: transposase, partial [Erysipelotrichaceae bacterium]|nr:transposase [Erysipelotrichaceae bacterium]
MNVVDPKLIDVINSQEEYIKKLEELLKNLEDSNKLKDEIIKNQKTQIVKDYRNSSKPSSATPNHPTIKNGRIKSGKLKGGQKGHEGHPRKNPSADQIIHINDLPEEVKANPEDYVLLDRRKSRKVVGVKVVREVIEFQVPIWKNIKTGALVYGQFPVNCVNEVNYDESVKAFLMVLTCHLNVSIRKAQEFIHNISEGDIVVSTGTICNLRKEFKKKSKKERDQIWNRLFHSPYMGSDTTFTRIQGRTGYIGIHCNDSDIYFRAGEKKGENLVTGTPLDGYQGVSVHDGEAVYSNHGLAHQQCLVHLFRYLRGAMEAEPELIWHKEAYDFLQEQTRKIETRKKERRESGHPIKIGDQVLSQEEIDQARARYVEIMELAKQEYPERPAVYVDGFNTAKRMAKQQESILYFLDHPWVPWHNNESERGARAVKRKTKQSDGFKSLEGAEEVTAFLTIVESARKKGENVYYNFPNVWNYIRCQPTGSG